MFHKIEDSLKNKCRTCMSPIWDKTNDINKQYICEVPMGSAERISIMELLQQVQPQIDVEINDNLPKVICLDCVKKLQETHSFLEKYRNVNKKFRSMLQNAAENMSGKNCKLKKLLVDEILKFTEETNNLDLGSLDDDNLDVLNLNDIILNDDNLDDLSLEYFNLDKLGNEIEREISNLEIDIDKLVNEDLPKGNDEEYENINDWSDFHGEPDIDDITDADILKLKNFDYFYSDTNDYECKENGTSKNKTPSKRSPLKREKNIKRNNIPSSDPNTNKKSKQKVYKNCQETNAPSQNKDAITPCQKDKNEIYTKSHEKSKTDIEINTSPNFDNITKNLQQNFSDVTSEIEDDSILCQEFETETPERKKADVEVYTSPSLKHKTTKNSQHTTKKCKTIQESQISSENEDDTIESETPEKGKPDNDLNFKPTTLDHKTTKQVPKKRNKIKETQIPLQNEDGSISCQECEMILKNLTMWQEHMLEHPKRTDVKKTKRPAPIHKCEYCNREFRKKCNLTYHLRTHTGETPFLCVECGKRFKYLAVLTNHMLIHKGEKNLQCPHCPKKFLRISGLYLHKLAHTKEKAFVCDICGKAFNMSLLLKLHKVHHNKIKNYPCEHCDKRFISAEKQRRHLRTHTGEKPYRCKYCERAFSQSNDCIKHLRQHLGNNVYRCELCPLRFPLARDMRVHFASHKDDDEKTRERNLEALIEDEKKLQIKLGLNKDVCADMQKKLSTRVANTCIEKEKCI